MEDAKLRAKRGREGVDNVLEEVAGGRVTVSFCYRIIKMIVYSPSFLLLSSFMFYVRDSAVPLSHLFLHYCDKPTDIILNY